MKLKVYWELNLPPSWYYLPCHSLNGRVLPPSLPSQYISTIIIVVGGLGPSSSSKFLLKVEQSTNTVWAPSTRTKAAVVADGAGRLQ